MSLGSASNIDDKNVTGQLEQMVGSERVTIGTNSILININGMDSNLKETVANFLDNQGATKDMMAGMKEVRNLAGKQIVLDGSTAHLNPKFRVGAIS